MTIDLSKVNFAYDFFSSTMPDGSTLILNNVSENFTSSKGEETIVKQVTIVIAPVGEDNNILCSSVIGTGNSKILLDTKSKISFKTVCK